MREAGAHTKHRRHAHARKQNHWCQVLTAEIQCSTRQAVTHTKNGHTARKASEYSGQKAQWSVLSRHTTHQWCLHTEAAPCGHVRGPVPPLGSSAAHALPQLSHSHEKLTTDVREHQAKGVQSVLSLTVHYKPPPPRDPRNGCVMRPFASKNGGRSSLQSQGATTPATGDLK